MQSPSPSPTDIYKLPRRGPKSPSLSSHINSADFSLQVTFFIPTIQNINLPTCLISLPVTLPRRSSSNSSSAPSHCTSSSTQNLRAYKDAGRIPNCRYLDPRLGRTDPPFPLLPALHTRRAELARSGRTRPIMLRHRHLPRTRHDRNTPCS
jgi:hypothetical protein